MDPTFNFDTRLQLAKLTTCTKTIHTDVTQRSLI